MEEEKTQPKHINPGLWERFLTKKKYDGYIHKFGIKYKLIHGVFKTIG